VLTFSFLRNNWVSTIFLTLGNGLKNISRSQFCLVVLTCAIFAHAVGPPVFIVKFIKIPIVVFLGYGFTL